MSPEKPSPELTQEINKRLSLNLLIQGAASHIFLTAGHLVKDELESLSPGLVTLYDRFAVSGHLNYCIGDNALMFGWPTRFWGYSNIPQPAFRQHPFLAKYGKPLAIETTQHLKEMAGKKGLKTSKFFHWLELMGLMNQVNEQEVGRQIRLEEIALIAISRMWNISSDRLDGRLTQDVAFGKLRRPKTRLGRFTRLCAIGYGGVQKRGNQLMVVAKAWNFPLLIHELVKGTAELICLHGLTDLDEETYESVVDEADQLEYEAWLMQAGPEMWRKFIAVAPREIELASNIMNLARSAPAQVEELMFLIVEEPNRATDMLRRMELDAV